MTLYLDEALYLEFTVILFNPRVQGMGRYFAVQRWLSEHGIDPRQFVKQVTTVQKREGAVPAVQLVE